MKNISYKFLLATGQSRKWKKIRLKKKAGIVVPLFFIWAKKSLGIGEIPDLKILIDWCSKTKIKILQLLPLNDTGFDFNPYNPQSSFALDPMYLSLKDLIGIKKPTVSTQPTVYPTENLEKELKSLAKKFPLKTERVDYQIKGAKLEKLWQIFLEKASLRSLKFRNFLKKNNYWLNDFCLFRILKEYHQEKNWENWEEPFRNRKKEVLQKFKKKFRKEIEFQKWLQWQLYEQLSKVKLYAKKRGIFLKGDLPWLISRDSADVWANRKYFDLSFSSGAPPDAFSKRGQRWGMPPLKWKEIFKNNFIYFKEKLKYAENFYDLLRIDHVVGLFRIWKIPISEPLKNKGLNGFFDPKDENLWKKQGRQILSKIIKSTKMLICAEDLGTIPPCCPKALRELGIPGIRVQRWYKNWKTSEFIEPENYKPLSVATLSTHDTSNFFDWWENETKDEEKKKFLKMIFGRKFPLAFEIEKEKLLSKNLEVINRSASIFCVLLLLEWLFLGNILKEKPSQYRFNVPGTISKKNWSLRMPLPLEDLLKHPITLRVKKIIQKTGRN